jgi:hypothetical protein
MKLTYRFRVKGTLRLNESRSLNHLGRVFLFELGCQQEVTHLSVTIPISLSELPSFSHANPGQTARLNLTSPGLLELRPLIRSLEGMLSLYGVESINMREPELVWVPESADERRSMSLFRFSVKREERALSDHPVLDFAYAGQAIAGLEKLVKHEVPMYFYRKGRQDLVEGYFIDAFYDFFLIIESLFANGNFRKTGMKQAFRANQSLQAAIATTLVSKELNGLLEFRPHVRAAYVETYQGRAPGDATDHLVELRGFLHHHTAGRVSMWHPDDHEKYELDAHVVGMTCGHLIQDAVIPLVYSEEGAKRFEAALKGSDGQK